MKKVKLIACSLVLLVSLAGASYAAWQDTVTVSNTAQMGLMRIEFVEEDMKGNNNQLSNIYPNISGNDLNNNPADDAFRVSKIHGPKETFFYMENLYPGVTVWYEAKIKNLGNIAAVLNDIDVEFSNTSEILKDNINVRGQLKQLRKQADGSNKVISTYSLPLAGTTKYGKKSDILGTNSNFISNGTGSGSGNGNANGGNLVTLRELEDYVNGLIKVNKQTLEPGDSFTFDIDDEYKAALLQEVDLQGLYVDAEAPSCLWFTLPKDAGNETKGQKAYFKIKFNFVPLNN